MKEKTNYSEGRELFVSKCNSCHKLSSPNEFTSAEWDSILVPMKKKAKLNTEQRNEIYNWILEIKKNYRNSQVSN